MKKKIVTLVDEEILSKAKKRAQRDGRALADIIQDALDHYLHGATSNEDAVHAAEKSPAMSLTPVAPLKLVRCFPHNFI